MGGSLENWDDVVPRLAARRRVLRYDTRGAGLSEKARGSLSIDTMVDDLAALTEALGISGRIALAGVAVGGAITLHAAARLPQRISAAVVGSPATGVTVDRRSAVLARVDRLERDGMRSAVEATRWPTATRPSCAPTPRALPPSAPLARQRSRELRHHLSHAGGHGPAGRARRHPLPGAGAWRRSRPRRPPALGSAGCPHDPRRALPGAATGHYMSVATPDLVAAAIGGFLDEVGALLSTLSSLAYRTRAGSPPLAGGVGGGGPKPPRPRSCLHPTPNPSPSRKGDTRAYVLHVFASTNSGYETPLQPLAARRPRTSWNRPNPLLLSSADLNMGPAHVASPPPPARASRRLPPPRSPPLPPTSASRLVVGNSAYVHAAALPNPANDAGDMAAALKEVGFEVILALDLDKRGFDAKVRDFARALDEGRHRPVLLCRPRAAGRRAQLPGAGRRAARRASATSISRRCSLDFVLKQMELEREGKTNIVFLDACRDNPLARNLARAHGHALGQRSAAAWRRCRRASAPSSPTRRSPATWRSTARAATRRSRRRWSRA